MEPWSASSTFFLFAALLQAVVGTAIVVRRPRVESAWVIGALFLLNAGGSVSSLILSLAGSDDDLTGWGRRTRFYFDRSTTFLIAYLALCYPQRPAWARRPWVLPTAILVPLVALLAAAAIDGRGLLGANGDFYESRASTMGYLLLVPLSSIPFIVLLLRWPALLVQEQSPVLRRQFQFVFAAFGMRAAHQMLQVPFNFFLFDDITTTKDRIELAVRIVQVAVLMAAFAYLLWTRPRTGTDTRRSVDFVLAFLLVGVSFAFLAGLGERYLRDFYTNPINEIDVAVLRPALLYFAIARYGLMGARFRSTPLGVAIVTLMALPLFTMGTLPTFRFFASQWDGSGSQTLVGYGLSGLFAIAATTMLVRILLPYLRPADPRGGVTGRVEDYVAAVEDLYRNQHATPEALAGLEPLRRALGVSDDQAAALREAVRSRWTSGKGPWSPGDRVLGRYEVVRLLGDGAHCSTHLARDLLAEEDVVLKRVRRLDPEARRALLHEAYQLARLSHPNVVRLLRTESIDDEPVLVLEHLEGGSLQGRLAAQARLAPEDVAHLGIQVLRGLAAAHDLGIVHRDVKPANILFDARGNAKVCDFGIARQRPVQAGLGDPTPTSSQGAGTLRYMAPEQVRGLAPDPRSDLYSVGVVLLEAASGEHPVRADLGDYEQRRLIVEGPAPVVPRHLPEPLRRALRHLLEKEPERRPARADIAAQELAAVIPRGTAAGSARPG